MKNKVVILFLSVLVISNPALAQGPPRKSAMSDPMVLTIVIIMLILLLVIGLLANVVMGAAVYYRDKQKEQEEKEKSSNTAAAIISTAVLLFVTSPLLAQDTKPAETVQQAHVNIGNLSDTAFYLMMGVLWIEILVVFFLLMQLRMFLRKEKQRKEREQAAYKPARWAIWWSKMNSFKPKEQEAAMDLGHDYDGIRELDNRLPPWWLYGFYLTIVFAGVYLWRYHVSHSAPLSAQEYQIAVQEAEKQKMIYLAKAAGKVDETTVKLLTDETSVSAGKGIFTQNCAACHGKSGEGVVGPNLTDDYWLHGGSIGDVFKTIKYGWPEKGMKSWKDDLSPSQIAQVASFIKSLHGSNPANAKEKQGELYQETGSAPTQKTADSAGNRTKIMASIKQ